MRRLSKPCGQKAERKGFYLGADINVGAGGVPLVGVELPAPLHDKVTGLQGGGQLETTTAGPDVGVFIGVRAVLVVEVGDDVGEKLELRGVLGGVDFGQGNGYGLVLLIFNSVVLGRPANAELSTRFGDGLDTNLATFFVGAAVGGRDGLAHGLICTRLLTLLAIGAGKGVVGVGVAVRLLIVAAGIVRVELGEGLGLEREAAGETEAGAVLVRPGGVLGVLEAPVDAVGVGVGFSLLGEDEDHRGDEDSQRGLGEGSEEH